MGICASCTRSLDDGLLYLDANEAPTPDQLRAKWKSCPRCSEFARAHIFLPLRSAFGSPVKQRRSRKNPLGLQSDCIFHRNGKNLGQQNTGHERHVCGGVETRSRAAPAGSRTPDVVLTLAQVETLVMDQAGWIELTEEGKKKLRTHLVSERSRSNRQAILKLRRSRGQLCCDACSTKLGCRFGAEYEELIEVHHRRPLAQGVQTPTPSDFALLCPTCHRAVHWHREEPMLVEQLQRQLAAGAQPAARGPVIRRASRS